MTGATNNFLLCFVLLMLIVSSSSAREMSPLRDGDDNPGDNKWTWKCIRLWDNYCIKNKKCEDKCQGADGKGYHHGHCELWTCVCCRKNGEDNGIVAPANASRAQLGPEQ